jgi:hypothetical protein
MGTKWGDRMVNVIIVVREPGDLKPEYSLEFELPEVPAIGSYISIQRLDSRLTGEDMIVRAVWWRLRHSTTGGLSEPSTKPGSVIEIFVECDPALGPYSSKRWRTSLNGAKSRGIDIEEFQVSRHTHGIFGRDDAGE